MGLHQNLVIIPTYNEKENIEAIIGAVFDLTEEFDVLIVDDNSPDGTRDIVRRLMKENQGRLHMEERAGKQGLGTAYIHGFKWALANNYDLIFEMDADFSHPPKKLEELLRACRDEGADIAVGSRYIKGGNIENWPLDRKALSYGASLYVRMITWIPCKDSTAGFVCYRRKVLETLDLDNIQFIGYAFQIEMKYKAWKLGFKIKEVPITFKDREKGQSKMSINIVNEAMLGVLQLRFGKN